MPQHAKQLTHQRSRNLLERVLDQPDLPAQIQRLPPTVLCRLIDKIGLEDASEIVSLATAEQLAEVFDEDLWRNERPGEEERFDDARFVLWLEVMLEAGESFAAARLAELPEDLLTLALHRQILVLELSSLAAQMQAADEVEARRLDKALENCLYEEVGEYQLMARTCEGWDTVLAVVLALDQDHHELLNRVLSRCCHLASAQIEEGGGLLEVLTSEEMLEGDLAGEREDRRAKSGYVSPATAKSFLRLALSGQGPAEERDPVTKAYFRELVSPARASGKTKNPEPPPAAPPTPATDLPELLRESGVLPNQSLPLLPAARSKRKPELVLVSAMRELSDTQATVFVQRSEEIAFLTNVLVTGCSFRQRRFLPIEALRAALATCNLGLYLSQAGRSTRAPTKLTTEKAVRILLHQSTDSLFRLAWYRLHQEVVDFAASVALQCLQQAAKEAGPEDRAALRASASILREAWSAGAPWSAIPKLDTLLAYRDAPTVDALCDLFDECPTLPPSNTTLVPRKRDEEEALQRFLSTPADIVEARTWLKTIADSPVVGSPLPT